LGGAGPPSFSRPGGGRFVACDYGEPWGSFCSLETAFRWLFVFLNNYSSTNDDGLFESFRFFNQKFTLVAGLARRRWFKCNEGWGHANGAW
jgi:hypothetical protein